MTLMVVVAICPLSEEAQIVSLHLPHLRVYFWKEYDWKCQNRLADTPLSGVFSGR